MGHNLHYGPRVDEQNNVDLTQTMGTKYNQNPFVFWGFVLFSDIHMNCIDPVRARR
jgi:hypothetical protein